MAGGITAMEILPGSANLFGGRGVIIKAVPSRTAQGMKFPGAPYTLKMACGENPKRVYGYGNGGDGPGGKPYSRMGNVAGYREAWQNATEYKRKWDKYNTEFDALEKEAKSPKPKDAGKQDDKDDKPADPPDAPDRNLQLDTLMGVLDGEILVQQHCYRADEMAQIIDLSKEFGYKVSAFHHGVEAYKIADLLAANAICGALWADWWGFKAEAYDGIRENIPMVHKAKGGCAIVHSDDAYGIQRTQPGSRQSAGRRPESRHQHLEGRGVDLAFAQPGEGARDPRQDRHAGARQGRGRRDLERRPLQRLQPRRSCLRGRRRHVEPR